MTNFSLINSIENIYFERTKEYFEEVKSSYENHNYRSTIVTLYSIVISDLVYKLIELRDVFSDEKAKSILDEIEKTQKQSPKPSEWESKLIELVNERTSLISPSLLTNIKNLKNMRNLSAHPVFTQDYNLYKPNKESAIALMRITLEELFTNPPLLSKGIFTRLLADISKHKNSLFEDNELKKFLDSRYFRYTTPEIKKYIFKSLWKFVFRLINKDCDDNRRINSRTLRIIYNQNSKAYLKEIQKESKYYSHVSSGEPLNIFLFFIGLNSEIYDLLEEDTKVLIKSSIKENNSNKLSAWFLSENLYSHLEWMKENEGQIELDASNEFEPIYQACLMNGLVADFYLLVIHFYSQIKSEVEDYYFRLNTLEEYMKDFDKDTFHLLLDNINSNEYLSDKKYNLINQDLIERIREVLDDNQFGREEDYPTFFKYLNL